MSAPENVSVLASVLSGWMVGALLIGAVCAAATWLVHRLLRELVPARFVWGAGMLLALTVGAALPWRSETAASPTAVVAPPATLPANVVPTDTPSLLERLRTEAVEGIATVRRASEATLSATLSATMINVRRAPAAVHWIILLAWPLASMVFAAVSVLGYRRLQTRVRRAEPAMLHHTSVLISEAIGPAVVGVQAPKIVVPRWLLALPEQEQQMVLAHESEHLRARDPHLLLAACAVVLCMPWNAALWWMLSRLRLAIEVDCDGRVLARGTARRPYGELLLAISSKPSGLQQLPPIPAFSFRVTHLERRLRTMTARPSRHSVLRRASGLLVTTTAVLAACGAELPTSAELEGMDVAAATARIAAVAPSASKQYFIDGRAASESEARAIAANRIASITVMKQDKGVQAIRLTTKTSASTVADDAATQAGSPVVTMTITQIDSTPTALRIADSAARLSFTAARDARAADTSRPLMIGDRMAFVPAGKSSDVLIFVDGVKATESAMKMPPDRIQSVEVIKGAAAVKRYGPDGANGVIHITTKKN